jgi:four helix bundle protein
METKNNNIILKLTIEFALLIIEYCEKLESKRKFVISGQLLKSGTSIGANAREAQNAESKSDFIHKMKIAAKESDETEYWLLLCKYSKTYPDCDYLIEKNTIIQKILSKIIGTSKRKSL